MGIPGLKWRYCTIYIYIKPYFGGISPYIALTQAWEYGRYLELMFMKRPLIQLLVGGLVAIFYFPINIGFLIIPIDEVVYFSEGWLKTTSQTPWLISGHRVFSLTKSRPKPLEALLRNQLPPGLPRASGFWQLSSKFGSGMVPKLVWGFHSQGGIQNAWFLRENPNELDDTGWWFGCWFKFYHILGIIIPTFIFFRVVETTKQLSDTPS